MRVDMAALHDQIWWHGGQAPLERDHIDWAHPLHGGLHLGSREQAAHRGRVLTPFRLYAGNRFRRAHDRGGDWVRRAKAARRAGFDALLYLNRYEGLGPLDAGLDTLRDAAFARHVPNASFSLLVLRQGVARPIPLDPEFLNG